MKKYNPLTLDREKDEPTFQTKVAKWWLNEIVKNHRFTPISTAEKALKQIKDLEK
jgi:hypothetical protein